MNPGPMFDRVYGALKEKILTGGFAPGERIDPAILSEELGSSVTPVRDALHRLAGEQLVLALPALGFRMPILTEPALGDLYHWMEQLLHMALITPGKTTILSTLPAHRTGDLPALTADLFQQIAASGRNRELDHAAQNANDRLHAVRIAEGAILERVSEEFYLLERCWLQDDGPDLRDEIHLYHSRRQTNKGKIVDYIGRKFR